MRFYDARILLALTLILAVTGVACAQSFAALVSPPRFELSTTPGKAIRAVVEITNADSHNAIYKVRTTDWTLDQNAGVQFDEALQADSCRPWVAIERREIAVPAAGKYRFRFEVKPPVNVTPRECRFALMIEGSDSAVQTLGGVSFPVAGRIGVIVYLAVGKVVPQLEIVTSQIHAINGVMTPVILIKNSGSAHGRLTGFLSGTDNAGKRLEFIPSNLPILPGETRAIALGVYQEDDKKILTIEFPIKIGGTLEWDSKTIAFDHRFAQ